MLRAVLEVEEISDDNVIEAVLELEPISPEV